MSEAWVLTLVSRYPHRVALARRAQNGSLFAVLSRLEARGFLRRRQDRYRLTRRGREELALTFALAQLAGAGGNSSSPPSALRGACVQQARDASGVARCPIRHRVVG
ncbi:MAG TPA: hypothetical protein VNR59_12810 [Gaiellaceae bacterium]|nr:hypothetical protein [Gaiellaceae bacterium]